jgi:hypothetical protein
VVSSETGLDFSSAVGLTYDQWASVGLRLGGLHSGIQWWLGDWFVFGHGRYRDGEMYHQALEETGRSAGGLYTLKWVAEKVGPEVRRADLSWSHHREVAKLPPDEQATWLARAVAGRWSVDLLRSTIQAKDLSTWRDPEPVGASTTTEPPSPPVLTPPTDIDCDRLRRLGESILLRALRGLAVDDEVTIQRLRLALGKDA